MSVRSGVFKDRSNNLDIMYASSDAAIKKGGEELIPTTESVEKSQSPRQFSFAEPTESQKRDQRVSPRVAFMTSFDDKKSLGKSSSARGLSSKSP